MQPTFGLYIHYPFCLRRCPYCAFYSTETNEAEIMRAYPRLILRELELRSPDWRGFSLSSIYFGGGTPSLMVPDEVRMILDQVLTQFTPVENLEITLEANPGTVSMEHITGYINAGINRISLGIQALSDARLTFLGRIHNRAEAVQSLEIIHQFPNLSLSTDLIVGTPLENTQSWDVELNQLLPIRPDSVSFYSLTVEEGTRLAQRVQQGERLYLSANETVALLAHIAIRLADAGYRHYEVSNWALPGSECRHNLHYWQRGIYLGLGPSAHSFHGAKRTWNIPDLAAYRSAILVGKSPPVESELLTEAEIRTEWIYLKLRQATGLDLEEYRTEFGAPPGYWTTMFERIANTGLGKFDGRSFQPNDRGLLLADEIALRILA